MLKPLVSIIIPVYNRENLIIETLESVNKQSDKNWECIVVDDHSTDNTFNNVTNYIKNKPNFKLVKRPSGYLKGANSCRNYGFELSEGEFINWFDSDDLMHKDFVKEKIDAVGDYDCIISKTSFFKNNLTNILGKEKRTLLTNSLIEDFVTLKVSWYLPDPMWRKSFLNNKELFSEALRKGQDRDFHIRRLIEKPKIKILDKYLTYYRQHDSTISNTVSKGVMKTYFNSLNNTINLLLKQPVSNSLKMFLLKSQIKNYPYMYNEKGILSYYFKLFKKLFVFNVLGVKLGVKFIIAVFLFKITGKGSFVLKG